MHRHAESGIAHHCLSARGVHFRLLTASSGGGLALTG